MLWDTTRNSRLPRLHKVAAQPSCLPKRVVTTHGHILINILTAHIYLNDPRTSTSATVATQLKHVHARPSPTSHPHSHES
jgi:hypothetical protein